MMLSMLIESEGREPIRRAWTALLTVAGGLAVLSITAYLVWPTGGGARPARQHAELELARQSILIRALLTDFQKTNPVSEADIKAEYDKFVADNGGKEYRASHILVETEKEAKDIMAQLAKKAKFEALAKKSSKDSGSSVNGGALDWANPKSYVKEFSEALVALKKGQTTAAPVKSQFGYHIIRLDDVRDAKLPSIDEIKPQIGQKLQQVKIDSYRKELLSKAKIE